MKVEFSKLMAHCAIVREERARAQRKEQARLERLAERGRREERVRFHARDHLRDVHERLRRTHARGDQYQKRVLAYMKQIDHLQMDITEQCLILGHTDPEDVLEEVQRYSELAKEKHQKKQQQQQQQREPGGSKDKDKNKGPEAQQSQAPAVDEHRIPRRPHPIRYKGGSINLGAPGPSEWKRGI